MSSPVASDGVEESVGLKSLIVIVLDELEGGVEVDVTVEAVISCVVTTVMTEPPLLVDRDVEMVREAVGVAVAVELGAAVDAVLDRDGPCVAVEQYAIKLGKHDD